LQSFGNYYTSLPKFSLKFSELNELNLMPVDGSGDNIHGRYEITGDYDPSLSYAHLKQTYEDEIEWHIKLTWSPDRNQFEGIYNMHDEIAGTFYIKPVKEKVFDATLRIEDIIEGSEIMYSRMATQTTLMKGNYKGDKAVAKLFIVDRKDQAQSIIDSEVHFQSYFKEQNGVVQVYD